ncbi:hypothetical protein FIBSPDRAFT_687136, partial [Athelia psychrophila]
EMHIGRSALDNLIRDAGISLKLARKCASERDEVAREDKDDRTIFRRYARAPKGQRATIDADFVRGDRYSIVAAISVDGYVGTRIVSGSLDSAEFFDFIVEDLPHMNPYPQDRSVLILDNCSIHKSEALREVVEGHG